MPVSNERPDTTPAGRALDAAHLATAVNAGAERFITNNSRDFPTRISEIEITCPSDLPDPLG